jgi:GT2 family glycosyltransferase
VSTEQQVTAYLPCYNVARYLAATIEGLLRQTHAPAEILIVDDGCTDDTIAVARRYPVRVVSHEVNRGLAAARNTALQAARTPLVASLDTDAVPEPDWLERLLPHFTDPRVAGVSGRMLELHQERPADRWRAVHMPQHWGAARRVDPPALSGSNTMFRRDAMLAVGGYCEQFRTNYEDCDVSRRLMAAGYRLVYEPRAIVYHHRRDTVRSVLRTSWNWDFHLRYYRGEYASYRRLWKDIVTSLYFCAEDWRAGHRDLVPIDLLRAITHFWWDLCYFARSGRSVQHPTAPSRGCLPLSAGEVHA